MKAALLALLLALSPVEGLADVGAPERPFDPASAGLLRTVAPLGGELFGVAFSADGRRLAVGCGNSVRIYEVAGWTELARLEPNPQSVFSVAFSPDGRTLAAGGFEGAVQLWDLEAAKPLRPLAGHQTYVGALAWSPDGRSLLTGSHDGTLRVWEPATGRGRELPARQGAVFSAAFSADGRIAATSGGDGSALLWRTEAWEVKRKLQADAENLHQVQFVAGGRVAGISAGAVTFWDAASGEPLKRTPLGFVSGGTARMLPDGRFAVVSAEDFALRVVDAGRGGEGTALRHHLGAPTGLAVHPSGRFFVSIGADRLLKVWGAKPGGMARVKPYGFCGIQVGQGAVPGEVIVMSVHAGTPAAAGGLLQGDLVRRIGGRAIATPTDVVDQIRSFQEGDEVDFVVERPDGAHTYRIRLARRPPEVP